MRLMGSAEPPTSTLGLLDRARKGDQAGFALLFQKYAPRLAVLIHCKLGSDLRAKLDVDDVLQEVFLTASQDLAAFQYQKPGSFMSWLGRIADHKVVDLARFEARQKRAGGARVGFRSPTNPSGFEPLDPQTPSRILGHKEELARLVSRLDSLPESYRQIIVMARVELVPTEEIAKRLGKTKATVAVLLHRALQRLKEKE
jgi:RNA polymerase sigma-70 factor (ECF subfamily)